LGVVALWLLVQPPQREWFIALNHFAGALPAELWSFLTLLGDTTVLLALLTPVLLWRPQVLLAAVAAIPAGALLSTGLKHLADALRPAAMLDVAQFNVIGPTLVHHSFPSGHTITAFAAASAVLACTIPECRSTRARVFACVVVAVAAAVGFSRIAVGAHWPADVLVGAMCGWMAGLSGALISRRFTCLWHPTRSAERLAALLALAGVWLLWRPMDYPLGAAAIWLASTLSVLTAAAFAWRSVVQQQKPSTRRFSRAATTPSSGSGAA
jgi:membrane-associated phospholipid phosphatase